MSRGGASPVARIRAMAMALPEAEERPFGGHTTPAFRVRDKFFVMLNEDASEMSVKAPKGVQGILVASDPGRFFVPRYVGPKGWVGVRLRAGARAGSGGLDWDEVAEMITESYCLIAPKRLAALVAAPPAATDV